jgi:hypothetical protein
VASKENKWSQFNPVESYGVREFSPLWQNIEIKNAKNEILF